MNLAEERKKIEHLVTTLDQEANNLLVRLGSFDDATLQTPIAPGVWSVMQVLSHIMMSERLSLKYVQKKLSFKPSLKKTGLTSRLRLFALKLYLISPLKVKAPKGLGTEHLPAQCSLAELKESWQADRQKLRLYISSLPEDLLGKEIFKHAFVGRLSLSQMLEFFQMHFRRHEKQILERLPK